MPHADYADGEILVKSEFKDRDRIRQVPGLYYDGAKVRWHGRATWPLCKALRGVFGADLTTSDALDAWAWELWAARIEPSLTMRALALDPDADVEGDPNLWKLQRSSVAFMKFTCGAICADDLGGGKTVQGLVLTRDALAAYPEGKGLVAATNGTKRNWQREAAKHAPNLRVEVLTGTPMKRRKLLEASDTWDVLVVGWDQLRIHSRLAKYGSIALSAADKEPKELNRIPWTIVVADEAHRAKDPTAKWTRALWAIGDDARFRYAFTGTPIESTPDDLWSLLRFVAPHEFPGKTAYIERYCQKSFNLWGGLEVLGLKEDTREEFYSILDTRFVRRPIEVLQPQLPAFQRVVRESIMSPKEAKAYRQIADGMVADIDGGQVLTFNPLTKQTRLRQFCASYAEVEDVERSDGTFGQKVTLKTPSCKIEALEELIEEIGIVTRPGSIKRLHEPIVVFAQSTQLLKLAATRLEALKIPHVMVTGEQNDEEKDAAVVAFQARHTDVILVNYQAGGEGLTLTAARIVVRLQRAASSILDKQAMGRIRRPGQTADSLFLVDIVTPGTVEEWDEQRQSEKGERFQEIARDQVALLRAAAAYGGKKEKAAA